MLAAARGKRRRRAAMSVGVLALASSTVAVQAQDGSKALKPVLVEEKRALLIGNADYTHSSKLVNTIPDVRALERVLREVGFDSVSREENLSMIEMARSLDEFAGSLGSRDLAFFYFSGHGLQVDGENYLLPVEFERSVASEVRYTTLAANRVRERLEGTGAEVRVMVLDACRNNPFGEGRSEAGGLAKMEVRAKGTLIAYAAGPGQLASDNPGGALGLYMTHLVPELQTASIELQGAFENVQARVLDASKGKQFPAIEDAIVGKVYLRGGPDDDGDDGVTITKDVAACNEHWGEVRGSEDPGEFEWYLQQCPEGTYSGLARTRLARLGRAAVRPPGTKEEAGIPPSHERAERRAGEQQEFDGMEFVWVPAGGFRVGSTGAGADSIERPVTRVRISQGYWLGKHEVTQSEWQAVMGTNPSNFYGCGRCPVENVSWDDAQGFIRQLNGRAGGSRYRLPTEAEWEYAVRAGTAGDRYGNLHAIAWSYSDSSGNRTHPVGQKGPNAWGLHDMLGNVWEWVQDWSGAYPGGSVTDPAGPATGSYRVHRGGSWYSYAHRCRSAYRRDGSPGDRNNALGFRLLRTE